MPEETSVPIEKPIRVLFADITAILGGAERSLLDILGSLDRREVTPEVLLFEQGPLANEIEKLGVPLHFIELGGTRAISRAGGGGVSGLIRAFADALRCAREMARIIKRKEIALVHSNTYKTHYLCVLLKLFARVPFVWHLRDLTRPTREGKIFSWLAGAVPDALIANSRGMRDSLRSEKARRCAVIIPNAIRVGEYENGKREPRRKEWGLAESDLVILHAGMFCPLKNQVAAVEILAVAAKKNPGAKLVLVGDEIYATADPDLKNYKTLVREKAVALGVADKVIYAGLIDDMADVYAAGDLLVSCSNPPESFGRCLVEAMAAGLPVVAFDAGGPSEIIVDGETGILVRHGDVEAMAEAVAQLLGEPERGKAMGQAGCARAKELYDSRRLGSQCAEIYRKILQA